MFQKVPKHHGSTYNLYSVPPYNKFRKGEQYVTNVKTLFTVGALEAVKQ